MIQIDLGTIEEFDVETQEFVYHDGGVVDFEYSLKVVYEWEAKWKKPFLKGERLSEEEMIDFYCRMALQQPFDRRFLTVDVISQLSDYITDPCTATQFLNNTGDKKGPNAKGGKFYTSEEIYATMISAGIPLEFENRNLNRLLTMLKIISLRNEKPKKMSKQDVIRQNASLNEQRKAMLKTKG